MLLTILDSISKCAVFVTLFGILFLVLAPICNRLVLTTKRWDFSTGEIIGAAISLAVILNFFTILSPYK